MNINFVNNNGTQKDIATLGFAVKSSKYASLYGKFVISDVWSQVESNTGQNRLSGQRKPGRAFDQWQSIHEQRIC